MKREATHWVMVPVSRETRQLDGRQAVPTGDLYSKAMKRFKDLNQGEIVGAPWFHRWQDSPTILPDGRVIAGPVAIFFAVLEKKDVQETPGSTAT